MGGGGRYLYRNIDRIMKYIKKFEKISEFENFKNGSEWITPNVSYIVENKGCKLQPYVKPVYTMIAGDIAYWNGSKVETVSSSKWNTSLGTPIGVVVIPRGMLPDGKVRIIGLSNVDTLGAPSSDYLNIPWNNTGNYFDTPLLNYNAVPITDNNSSNSNGSNPGGNLPSDDIDNFIGPTSFIDPLTKYRSAYLNSLYIPSPYLGDNSTFNTEYNKDISGYNNLLSDFNGLTNTQTLVGLGSDYEAANACWNYNGGVSGTGLQWYLPAMGELGFLIPRLKTINNALSMIGMTVEKMIYFDYNNLWSSTEGGEEEASLLTLQGSVGREYKDYYATVRPFAMFD